MGTGGIKPCVASFGGDQFEPYQEKMLSLFFSVFYFSINAGSMISTFVSPIFRSWPCLGQDSCYPLAFGVPAVLMVIATLAFMSGSYWYKKPPPQENIFGEVFRAGKKAVRNKWKGTSRKRSHWLEYYFDTHRCENDPKCLELQRKRKDGSVCQKRMFIDDIKSLLRLLVMYLPVPMFWALYDQQGSSWTIQALQMKCRLWGDVMLLPDQMQTLNAVLILASSPCSSKFIDTSKNLIIIYPLLGKCFKLTLTLRKMIGGGVLAAIAFLISAALQLQVNTTLPDLPADGRGFVSVMNNFEKCTINVSVKGMPQLRTINLAPNTSLINDNTKQDPKQRVQLYDLPVGNITWLINYSGADCTGVDGHLHAEVTYQVESCGTFYLAVVLWAHSSLQHPQTSLSKELESSAWVSRLKNPQKPQRDQVDLAMDKEYSGHLALCRKNTEGTTNEHPCDPRHFDGKSTYISPRQQNYLLANGTESKKKVSIYEFITVQPGSWKLYKMFNVPKKIGQLTMSKEEVKVEVIEGVEFTIEGQGGVYMLAVTGQENKVNVFTKKTHFFQSVQDNIIPIYWQVPQIAIMTAAEILFSITGYEFAYSQAAPSMKSIVQALWLLTVSAGDAIIVVIALMKIPNMAVALVMYAGMMLAVMAVFALLAIFYYDYNYYTGDETESLENFELDAGDYAVDASKDALNKRLSSPVSDYGGTSSSSNGGGIENTGYTGEQEDRQSWREHF
uniref:Uncharacterized protein n=1 Tax=Ditylenchus dipsaci TaxID=166011 RepID=A0A915DAN0_9BILA